MTDYLPPVVARIEGQHAKLVQTLRSARNEIKAFAADVGKTKATVTVDADLSRMDAKLQQARAKARKFVTDVGRLKATMVVDADLTRLHAKLQQAKAASATIAVKLDVAAGEISRVHQQVKATRPTVTVKLELAADAKQKIERQVANNPIKAVVKPEIDRPAAQRVRAYLDAFRDPIRVLVTPELDIPAARRVAALLDAFKEPITATIRPQVNQASALRSRQRLDVLTQDRIVNIRARVSGSSGGFGSGGAGGGGLLGTLIALAPALAPVVAWLGSFTVAAGAAAVATGVFGAAVIPQIKAFSDLNDAQKKARDAVTKYGGASEQAAKAQDAFVGSLTTMPEATRQAAGAFLLLKQHFLGWSDSLARFTMAPVAHGMGVLDALLPKLSPLVEETSAQFDRLITMLGGGINSGAFDGLMSRFTEFTGGVLKRGVDGILRFSRVLSEGRVDGPIAQFMAYAKAQGPAVRETLANLSRAISNILKASAEAGPGMLALVNSFARLVAAVPPSVIANVMQLALALKLMRLGNAGIAGAATALGALRTQLVALRTVSIAAGGGLGGLRAAFMSLSGAAKASVVVAGVAALALVLGKLSDIGKKAPPDLDKMSLAVGRLGMAGKVSGEAMRVYGGDLKGLGDSVRALTRMGNMDKVQNFLTHIVGMDSTPVEEARKNLHAFDQALASLVQGGHADIAAAAFDKAAAAMKKQGLTAGELRGKLGDYKGALADAAFQSRLVAQSQGLFGQQALDVSKKLNAQKQSADGLRQSIQALNDVNRSALDGQIGFEAAIDAATKAIKDNGRALAWKNGHLALGTEKARNEASALSDLAAKTDANAAAARDNGQSWSSVYKIYERGRDKLIDLAQKMGLTRDHAKQLADQILKTPDKTASLKGDLTDLKAKLADAEARLKNARGSKRVAIQGEISDLENKLAKARRDLDALNGKTATTYVTTVYHFKGSKATASAAADGAMYTGPVRKMAEGGQGRPAMMARGGSSILWAEAGDESYIPHDRRPRSRSIAEQTVAIMGGHVSWGGSGSAGPGAGGGGDVAGMGTQVAKGLWQGMSGQAGWLAGMVRQWATATIPGPIADALGIRSPSRVAAALGRWVGHGMVQGLTGSTSSVKAATLRLARSIDQVFHDEAQRQLESDRKQLAKLAGVKGSKAAEKRADLRADMRHQQHLLAGGSSIAKLVERDNAKLLKLASQRDDVAKKLKAAQGKLADLRHAWTDKRNQIAGGIMSGVSVVTDANATGRPVNASDVLANLKRQAQKAIRFAALLKQLKQKGLRSDLIEQIAAAGPDAGYDTALALAGGSRAQISEINRTQKSLVAAANSTGKVVADAMYGAGIKAAEGLVKGLAKQQKAIEKQMLAIAKAMEKAIKKALGIKSPSTVMAELGDYTAKGLAMGINRSSKHAAIAAAGMAMSVQQAASLSGRGAIGPVTLGPGPGAGGGGMQVVHEHIHVHLDVNGHVLTPRTLVDVFEEEMLKRGGRRSQTYQPYHR